MASLLHFPSLCFSSPSYANIPTIHLSPPISSSSTSVSTTSNAFNFSSVLTRQKPQILGFCTRGIRRVPGNPNLPLRVQSIITTGPESQSQVKKREPMIPPYNVLITGSTKGIGYALAKEFLKSGDNVIICSRSAERVESAVQNLNEEFGAQRVSGTVCDVRKGDEIKKLVTFARDKLKYIDIWINNAGSNAYSYKPLSEASDEDLIEVVTTNSLGLMICCREAITMMSNQPRGGHIFNIDGAGSDGRPTPREKSIGADVYLANFIAVLLK